MGNINSNIAADEISVGAVYKNKSIAEDYIGKRLMFSWQKLLHNKQTIIINKIIREHQPEKVLEIAPGPARLAVHLEGIKFGIMVENSEEMISIAKQRLCAQGIESIWKILNGNAFKLDEFIEDSEFDLAFTFRFVRHFHLKERERLYELIGGRLKKHGVMIFDVVNSPMRKKIDSKNCGDTIDDIHIYDATYTEAELFDEMDRNGFKVKTMEPAVRRFGLQSWFSYKFDDILPWWSMKLVAAFERIPSRHPLEWIVVCQKM